jgi:quercetin 2,3-dioxygenase
MEMVSYVLDDAGGSVTTHVNARMFAALLDGDERAEHSVALDRYSHIQAARGEVALNDVPLQVPGTTIR